MSKKSKSILNKIRRRIIASLRQTWSMYDENRKTVMDGAVVRRARYNKDGSLSKRPLRIMVCQLCGEEVEKLQADHIKPVGKEPEFPPKRNGTSWNNYILDIFCPASNLQPICKICHLEKTAREK